MDRGRARVAGAACAQGWPAPSRMRRWLLAAMMIAALMAGHILSLHDSDGDHALLGPSSTWTGVASSPEFGTALESPPASAVTALDRQAGSALNQLPAMAATASPIAPTLNVLLAVTCAIALILAFASAVVLTVVRRRTLSSTFTEPIGPRRDRLIDSSGRRPDRAALGVLRV